MSRVASDGGERRSNENRSSTTVYGGLKQVNPVTNSHCSSVDGSSIASRGEYAHLIRQRQPDKLLIRTRKGTPGSSASFYLRPFSYFDEDPSMSSYDGEVIKPTEKGANIDTLGFPKTTSTCAN